ncbi:MAG: pentapeptide repeat-containing protein, partial [Pseudomonadota bacterium]
LQLARTGSCPNSELSDTDLSYKALGQTKLNGANLRRANFMRTELKYAKLIGADLRSANFTWADLYQANFTNANLSGALLAESRNLSEAIFCRTVMPDGAVSNLNC